jgi:protoporphyrinogen oxidase
MKIAIIGAGFTGLSAAYKLSALKHQVTIFEKEKTAGGLGAAFRLPSWKCAVEKHYHHWFTNDFYIISLVKELGLEDKLITPNSLTSIYCQNRIFPFNSPGQLLSFSPLSLPDRLRTGIVYLYLKLLPKSLSFSLEKYSAFAWSEKFFGRRAFSVVWKPLLSGKFGRYDKQVNMAWLWARIKKRTLKLLYMTGGHEVIFDSLITNIKRNKGVILTNSQFESRQIKNFDKIIVTAPSAFFIQMFPSLPPAYKKRFMQIPHLHALTMLLVSKEKLLDTTYWLNINERKFPFVGLIQHTNMIDKKYYGNRHIAYIANYLSPNHPYLTMTKEELFQVYLPYLKIINPKFNPQPTTHNPQLFSDPYAQPVFPVNYSQIKPGFLTPIKNVYLANMDMVYPWDRGTNYAVELGFKIAEKIQQ